MTKPKTPAAAAPTPAAAPAAAAAPPAATIPPAATAAPRAAAPPAAAPTTRAYVDALESGKARLLLSDAQGEWQTYHLPAAALPANIKEGSWLELSAHTIPAPSEFDSRGPREKLGRKDDGKNFSL